MIGIIILSTIIFIVIFLVGFYFISLFFSTLSSKVPYIPTFDKHLSSLKKINLEKGKTIIDLGCGDGKALRFFEKQFGIIGYGYDINHFAIIYGKILNKLYKSKVKIERRNFLKLDKLDYDYIYLYLFQEFLEKMEDWIFETKNKETIIISNSFQFKKHKAFKIIDGKIYLYK